jgi:hypothetical protein
MSRSPGRPHAHSDYANTDNPEYTPDTTLRGPKKVVVFQVDERGWVCGTVTCRDLRDGEETFYQVARRTTERVCVEPENLMMPDPRAYGIALDHWPVDADGRGLSMMEARLIAARYTEAAA